MKKSLKSSLMRKSGIAVLAVLLLAGCATTIPFQVQRVPTMNTLGIQSMAVMQFETSDGSPLQREMASRLTSEAKDRIGATGQFKMIDSSVVDQHRQSGDLADHVDALFIGKIVSLNVREGQRQAERTNPETKEKYMVTVFQREVTMEFEYGITKTRDNSILGPVRKRDRAFDESESQGRLDSPQAMAERIVRRNVNYLNRDVAPYTVTEKVKLEKETSKDKAIVNRAKDADAMVKSGSYKQAEEAYLSIYADTKSWAAAYNAAILIKAQRGLVEAATFMQQVYNDTGNPRADVLIASLRKEMETEGLLAAYEENLSQRDTIIALLLDTLPVRMPSGAKVAVLSNSREQQELAENIVNAITSGLIEKRVTVVDRTNQALLAAEKDYQTSGDVSDDDLVRLGNAAGANTFVLISVSGTGGNRRLIVRMLDTERGTILYQSPADDSMNL